MIYHPFSDQSGCIFLDLTSGETLSVMMSEAEIVKALSDGTIIDTTEEHRVAIKSLIQKNILTSLDNRYTDA